MRRQTRDGSRPAQIENIKRQSLEYKKHYPLADYPKNFEMKMLTGEDVMR